MLEQRFHGLELPVRSFSGARALRVVHPAGQDIGQHRHDWPLLTVPALGGYVEETDDGQISVPGPAAILHPAGRCHANCIHAQGMETFSIEFDPDWLQLKRDGIHLDRSHYWIGGRTALAARRLSRLWCDGSTGADHLQRATAAFVRSALGQRQQATPPWFEQVLAMLAEKQVPETVDIARRLGLNAAWLARAYREAAGEGLHETVRRRRLEQAVALLRGTDESIAAIAAAVGFCDQSHLNRAAREFTGRTPLQLRAERSSLDRLRSAA